VLRGVAVFWAAGLVWLYLMLAAAALTVVSAGAAAINIRRRMAKHRHAGHGSQLPHGPHAGPSPAPPRIRPGTDRT